jgi:hypothetical protein
VFLFRAKEEHFKGTKFLSARFSPPLPSREFGFMWKGVNSKEFCVLWNLSIVLYCKKNGVSETSALGPKGSGDMLLICI